MTTMKTHPFRTALAAAATVGLALGLAACSNDAGDGGASGSGSGSGSDGDLKIVTSTKVWADVADAVIDDGPDGSDGSDSSGVEIIPIIASNDTDPHSYQPTAADMAKVEQADILIAGGGHYDAWLTEAASSESKAIIITAIPDSGHDHDHEHEDGHEDGDGHEHDHDHDHEVNEHIWYNTGAVKDVAAALAAEVTAKSTTVKASDEDVVKRMDAIDERKKDLPAAKTAQVHPLADDIIADSAVDDITPAGYRSTTLSESEPTAADVAEMLKTIESGNLDYLIDAPQTRDQVSQRLVEAAQAKGLRIVNVYEAPGPNETFFDLYERILDDLEQE